MRPSWTGMWTGWWKRRKKKNLTPDGARDLLHDANYFGTVRISSASSSSLSFHIAACVTMTVAWAVCTSLLGVSLCGGHEY